MQETLLFFLIKIKKTSLFLGRITATTGIFKKKRVDTEGSPQYRRVFWEGLILLSKYVYSSPNH